MFGHLFLIHLHKTPSGSRPHRAFERGLARWQKALSGGYYVL